MVATNVYYEKVHTMYRIHVWCSELRLGVTKHNNRALTSGDSVFELIELPCWLSFSSGVVLLLNRFDIPNKNQGKHTQTQANPTGISNKFNSW